MRAKAKDEPIANRGYEGGRDGVIALATPKSLTAFWGPRFREWSDSLHPLHVGASLALLRFAFMQNIRTLPCSSFSPRSCASRGPLSFLQVGYLFWKKSLITSTIWWHLFYAAFMDSGLIAQIKPKNGNMLILLYKGVL